jgi:hypothetical protein
MNTPPVAEPAWTTSSFGDAPGVSPRELSALREHAAHCRSAHVGLFVLRCGAEAMTGFVAGRQVTTLAILSALAAIVSWWA